MENLTKTQKQIVNNKNNNLTICASAGCGKTYTIIKRIIKLIIDKQINITNLLIITFTNNAADQIKEKILKSLIDQYNNTHNDFIKNQIDTIYNADISTYHSFCEKNIKKFGKFLNINNDFLILDETLSNKIKNKSFNKILTKILNTNAYEDIFNNIFYTKNIADYNKLKQYIIKMYNYCMCSCDFNDLINKTYKIHNVDNFDSILTLLLQIFKSKLYDIEQQLLSILNTNKSIINENLLNYTNELISYINNVTSCQSLYQIQQINLNIPSTRLTKLTNKNLIIKNSIYNLKHKLCDIVKYYCFIVTHRKNDIEKIQSSNIYLNKIFDILLLFKKQYEEDKKNINALDFDDLIHNTYLLLNNKKIAYLIKNKYKYIFVDEFQDTDEIQNKIIDLLSKNNTFIVGDYKQCIYEFRNCNPKFFFDKCNQSKNTKKLFILNNNFRSTKNIIKFVNKITKILFPQYLIKENCLKYSNIYPQNDVGSVNVHIINNIKNINNKNNNKIYDLIKDSDSDDLYENAIIIANIIQTSLQEKFYNLNTKQYQQIQYKDICIITRNINNDNNLKLINFFNICNIPINYDLKNTYTNCYEINILISLLSIIDNFNQDIYLIASLTSIFGQFTYDDIIKIKQLYYTTNTRKKINFYSICNYMIENYKTYNNICIQKLKSFKKYILELKTFYQYNSIGLLIHKIIEDNNYMEYINLLPNNKEKSKNVINFIEYCDNLDATYKIYDLVNDYNMGLINIPSNIEKDNCIHFMSIHKSKGLEYPIVIINELSKKYNMQDKYDTILYTNQLGFTIPYYYNDINKTKEESVTKAIFEHYIDQTIQNEEKRILYTAITRAKYKLHLICNTNNDFQNSHFNIINKVFKSKFINIYKYSNNKINNLYKTIINNNKKLYSNIENKNINNLILNYDSNIQKYNIRTTASNIINSQYTIENEKNNQSNIGSLIHNFLSTYNINKDIKQQIKELIQQDKEKFAFLLTINTTAINNIQNIINSYNNQNYIIYREKKFIVNLESQILYDNIKLNNNQKIIINGIIDLLIINKQTNEAHIYDYKYSNKNNENLIKTYTSQLNIYAKAIQKILNTNIVKKTIINLKNGNIINII